VSSDSPYQAEHQICNSAPEKHRQNDNGHAGDPAKQSFVHIGEETVKPAGNVLGPVPKRWEACRTGFVLINAIDQFADHRTILRQLSFNSQ
jgi:hypothetical protein